MNELKDQLQNLAMETRLSLEMQMEGTASSIMQLNSSLQTIVEKYQQLNALYVNECSRRRKVHFSVYG